MAGSNVSTSVQVTGKSSEQHKRENIAATPISSHQAGIRPIDRSILPKYKHVLAIHSEAKTSCLTRGVEPAPSFEGFKTLMVLVILVSNLRLMLVNFKKYGVLICLQCHDYRRTDVFYGALLFCAVPCHLFIAYWIELAAASQIKGLIGRSKKSADKETAHTVEASWSLIALAHGVNASLNLAVATYVVYYMIHHPGIGTICELHAIIVWLKVCSYALTNRDLRHAHLAGFNNQLPALYKACPYPQNISFRNISYFWMAPTLVYQPVYPRTDHIRWGFVVKRVTEMLGLSVAIWIASAQYAVPLLQNSLPIISELDVASIFERVMKLSSISLFCWLAGFYAIFQSGLNALAEVMRFADRSFYSDWWNSPNIRTYWSSWNKPVYQFMKRHIFIPLIGRGYPPLFAVLVTFTFSAILHEMAVGVPTHNIIGVAFMGMMFQLPLILLTDYIQRIKGLDGPTIGNVIFWVSFVLVGQPLAALLYFFAWQAKYGSATRPEIKLSWT